MISPARIAALDALRAITSGKADLPAALATVRPSLTDERDRALTTDLVTGTLRWQGELDFLIAHFSKRALAKLDPDVRDILRLGVYQLVHLDRVPAAAAVNDAVALTRRVKKSSAAGLVNAVLRSISRNSHRLPLPQADSSRIEYLETTLSHPRWLAARWLSRYGFDITESWERFDNVAPPLTLRVNRLKTDVATLSGQFAALGVDVAPGRYAPDCLVVIKGNPLRTPLAGLGMFFIQDEASQLVALLGMPRAGEFVLDACASPGGKTTEMAAMTGDGARIVAADVRDARMALLRETVVASGAKNIELVQADLKTGLPFKKRFDLVFVDAPCSGLGTIRRDPDIKWRRSEADLSRFAEAQRTMLRHAADAVRPGGRLVYSTCSSEPEENDEVVEAFIQSIKGFEPIDMRGKLPVLDPVLDNRGVLRTSPVVHGLEAFYGVVLRRSV